MKIAIWNTPIQATYYRSNELEAVSYETGSASVHITEENSNSHWTLKFTHIQALRITTWESAGEILKNFPDDNGGFFEVIDSELCRSLGAGVRDYMMKSRHFIICCYDEIVEVVAHQVDIYPRPS